MKVSSLWCGVALFLSGSLWAELPGEGPRLGNDRISHDEIASGELSLKQIRRAGLKVFATPFNKRDGYGDGPMDPADTTTPGGRPTLQNNGTFLRINGLDGQTCLECHSIVSNASVPARLGIGGVGGSVTNAIFQPTWLDVSDLLEQGEAAMDGRFINPPFLFGSGGIELLGKEMTAELQGLKAYAQANPGQVVQLETKGVQFGEIIFDGTAFDTSGIEGVDPDLIVRPFGRKGEFSTIREFDVIAMMFHFGMQPVEAVGVDVDSDGDGVVNEILKGEISALSIFNTNLERPIQETLGDSGKRGRVLFDSIGCSACHMPELRAVSRTLSYSEPEVHDDPSANNYYSVDLSKAPARFARTPGGGIVVPLFADLKRHNMGSELAESFGHHLDPMFTTARLWGVADTAPYMHDGRALTLGDAILMHGGEAEGARDEFAALSETEQTQLLRFLRSLRTPKNPVNDLQASGQQ